MKPSLLFLFALLSACTFSTIPNLENTTTYDPTVDISHIEFDGGEGTSPDETVVILNARNNKECLASEYAFLKKKFGDPETDWQLLRKKTRKKENNQIEVIKIKDLKTDSVHTYYFKTRLVTG